MFQSETWIATKCEAMRVRALCDCDEVPVDGDELRSTR